MSDKMGLWFRSIGFLFDILPADCSMFNVPLSIYRNLSFIGNESEKAKDKQKNISSCSLNTIFSLHSFRLKGKTLKSSYHRHFRFCDVLLFGYSIHQHCCINMKILWNQLRSLRFESVLNQHSNLWIALWK